VVSIVSGPISFNLVGPKFGSRFGQPEQVAVVVPVPVATIQEDHGAPFWPDDIWLPRKICMVKSETVSEPVYQLPNDVLRLGIFPPNTGNHVTAFFGGNDVCHWLI
jgi:hypothetical protein